MKTDSENRWSVRPQTSAAILLWLSVCVIISCGGNDSVSTEQYFTLTGIEAMERVASEQIELFEQRLISGLSVPWGMVFLPDGRMLISERHGEIRMVRNGALLEEPLEGTPGVRTGGTSGLMDLALHPDYEENGWIYITYSHPRGEEIHNTAVMRVRLEDHRLVDHERIFLGQPLTPITSHSGSRMLFRGRELFFTIGDRGAKEWAQDLSSHAGTVLRIMDDGEVPEDNPFVRVEGAQDEIWSWGHRNIQGLDFHPETGHFWAVEHGPRGGDELNLILKAENYGWPVTSASGIANDGSVITELREKEGMQRFVHEWTPSLAPSALTVVTSHFYPEWDGNLLISGLSGSRLVRLVMDDDQVVHEESLLEGQGRFRNVMTGPDGFLYIANESLGEISRLVPASLLE